jgi:acid phosphatase (class A)
MNKITRRFAIAMMTSAMLVYASPAFADDAVPFVTDAEVQLQDLIPAPPAKDSAETKAELAAYHTMEAARTKEQADFAVADDDETVFRFLDGMGVKIDPAKVPLTAKFFERVAATEGATVDPVKKIFARPRPPLVDPTIKPLIELSKSGSYPSGHATLGMLFGITLSKMVPEKKDAFMARAVQYGQSRMLVGVHYPSDLEASKMAGAAVGNVMLHSGAARFCAAPFLITSCQYWACSPMVLERASRHHLPGAIQSICRLVF